MKEPLAHISEDGRKHFLSDHLNVTAHRASAFASVIDSECWARAASLLHDLGKAHPDFQVYLCNARGIEVSEYDQSAGTRPNHSGAGAILVYEKWKNLAGKTFAYLAAGHHAGLPDWFGGRDSLSWRLENEKNVAEAVRYYSDSLLAKFPEHFHPPTFAMYCKNQDALAYHLWVRMLFSCLVDADFLDTERFMDGKNHALRSTFPSFHSLKVRFDQEMDRVVEKAKKENSLVNRIRADILNVCRAAASEQPGIFSLTVPTGGGKTLSGTAFALEHAIRYDKKRIIYVIPYTSIIEQTADVLRKHFGAETVVEHHSNIAQEKEQESPQFMLAAENWDAPIIVTTSVQFFESLYAAKPSRCRKLHNMSNSVIILDEAQLLPPELLFPCVEALNRLVCDYKATIVLSTATQPALPNLNRIPTEIIPNPEALYLQLKRTKIIFPSDMDKPLDWLSLSAELARFDQVLCIVNTRKDCHDLWSEMPEDTIHLSALMCGEHRSRIIADIKKRLACGDPCRVISTQLVEAGVDVDFPVVYRALAGLDSINQAAGRCNREGWKTDLGEVRIFIAPKPAPPGLMRKGEDTTREMAILPGFTPDTPDAFQRYFKAYYSSINDTGENWWRENLVKNVNPDGNVQFRTAGREFRLIKEDTVPIIVRYEGNDRLIEKLRFAGTSREVMRALQRYTVNVRSTVSDRLLSEGRVEEIQEGILVQADSKLYCPKIGLDIYREVYEPEDLLI
ncbi:MAG: CRISPR-associated helicase Cas3' [Syntrophales bacterium]|nr:CRISPR-associated helicase Cas3' [Syntrophales bacterium]